MSEQESSSLSVLVAAAPQDEQAFALVRKMRDARLRVIFANTATMAAHADEAAVYLAVLRPDTWKTPTIATVMRLKPTCLIPVLAEPMELPRGPWTHEALSIGENLNESTQEIIQVVRDYLAVQPAPISTAKLDEKPLTVAEITKFKKRRRPHNLRPLLSVLLVLLVVGFGAAAGYRYLTAHPSKSPSSAAPTTAALPTYIARTPGLCDSGGGQWEQADRYKKDRKVEIYDRYISTRCQSDGLLIMRSGAYSVYSEVFFDGVGISPTLASHYYAQVDASVVSGDAQASFTLDVHVHGYGRYGFDINTFGHWETNVNDTVDGSPMKRLSIGFFPKASQTYRLAVEVNGPVMSFFIDGTRVTTVTDTTYTENSSIAFGVDDYTATQPISALFSNFQYKELPVSPLISVQAVATATTQAQAALQKPYSTQIPGYGCDQGGGQWQPLADAGVSGTQQCLPNGFKLTNPQNDKMITEANFYWLDGHFPQNYKVAVQVDVSAAGDGCAGLSTRVDAQNNSYTFIICANGSWAIILDTDTFHTLAQGQVRAHNSYKIMAMSDGSTQSLFINDELIGTANNAQLQSTDHISLNTGLYTTSQSISATFSNFVFTPLP